MADDRRGPLTYEPVPSAEEIARRRWLEVQRKEEIARRQQELLDKARREEARRDEANPDLKGQKSHARTRRPKTVTVDGVEMPRAEAEAKIPAQMDLEDQLASSPLRERALRESRIEELVSKGKSQAEADQIARKEQEGRASAFKLGQETIRNSKSYQDKETRALASGLTNSAVAFGSRVLGYHQAADEAEATSAGLAYEMSRVREEQHPYPRIQGALAGAAANSIQMLPGMIAAPITGPGVGMALMSGQYGTQEYSRAAYEGAEAGLAGDELDRYARIQGGIEAAVMPIFSAIPGMKGLEGRVLRSAFAKNVASHPSVRNAIKSGVKLTKETGAELAEELTTEFLHGIATEKLLDQDVDFKEVMADTVLQTLLLMGASEVGQQAGNLATRGERRAPPTLRDSATGDRGAPAAGEPPALTQPEQAQQFETPVLKNPAIDAFLAKPESMHAYDAAVAAGMTPLQNPNRKERAKYAAELQKMEQAPPRPSTPDPAMLEPTAPPVAVGDDYERQFEEFLMQAGANGPDAGSPAGPQLPATPAESQNPPTPAAHTSPEQFEAEYLDTKARFEQSAKGTPEHDALKGRMAELFKADPYRADEIEKRKKPPGAETGGASPDQPMPPAAGPVSKRRPLRGMEEWGNTPVERFKREATERRLKLAAKAIQKLKDKHPLFADEVELEEGSPEERVDRFDSAGSDAMADSDAKDKQRFRDAAAKFDQIPDHARDDAEAAWNLSQTVVSGSNLADYVGNILRGKSQIPKGVAHPEIEDPDVRVQAESVEYRRAMLSRMNSPKMSDDARRNVEARNQGLLQRLKELGVTPNEVGYHEPLAKYEFNWPRAVAKPTPKPAPELRGLDDSVPEKPPVKGSIGYNSEGVPVFESKTGLRTVGGEIEQAGKLKPGKGGEMQAELAAPREDRFKTTGELDEQNWWDKSLTGAGRADILKAAGLQLPNKVLWNNMKPAAQAKVRHMKPPAAPATGGFSVIESPDLQLERKRNEGRDSRMQAIRDGDFGIGDRLIQPSTGRKGVLQAISLKSGTVSVKFDEDGSVLSGTDVSGFVRDTPPAEKKPLTPPSAKTPSDDKRFPPPGRSLRSIVLSEGGISAKSLRKDYSQKDLKSDGLLGIMRISGLSLDVMAQTLESSGALRTPAGRSPADWLIEQLKANADAANAEYTDKEIEAQLNKEREEYERLKENLQAEGIDTAGLEELRQNSIEAGFHEEGELSDEQAQGLIDISFDFGANVAARVGDIVEFTDLQGKKKVGLLTKLRPDGRVFIEPERRTDNVGRPTSTRYEGMELRGPGEFKKIGTSPFPATLNQFYSKWDGKSEPEIKAEFTVLWDSLDADDKGRLAGRLRKFGINAKVNNATDKLAAAVAARLVNSREIPGKIREIYDIANEYPNLEGGFDDTEKSNLADEMWLRIDLVGLELGPMIRAAMILPEMRRDLLHGLAKTQFGQDIADALFDDDAAATDSAAPDAADEDAFTLKRPEKPKPKPTDFGTNDNTKQGGLFDAGKKGDLPGQELLFNSDPGDLNNPKTQENKAPAAAPEDPRAALREQLREQMAAEVKRKADEKSAKEAKPKTPKTPRAPKATSPAPASASAFEYGDAVARIDDPNYVGRFEGTNESGDFIVKKSGARTTWPKDKTVRSDKKVNYQGNVVEKTLDETAQEQARKPKSPAKEAAEQRTQESRDKREAAAEAIRAKLKSMGRRTNMLVLPPIDPEFVKLVADYAIASMELGINKFREFVIDFKETFGETNARELAPAVEEAWGLLPEFGFEVDSAGSVADVLGPETKPAPATGWAAIPGHFADQLLKGEQYTSISEARREAGDIIGTPVKPGTAEAKQLDEAIEYGIVQAGRSIVEAGGTNAEIYDKLVDLYERQPVLGVRDSTSMLMQAYSTPVPLAWLASTLGNVTPETKVYEPTAGNGMLLIGTDVKNAFANELDKKRAAILRDQGFNVTEKDAATAESPKVEVILANPPFGKVKDDNRNNIEFNVDGFKTTEIDHAIALQSLKGMKPGGHAVLILAAKGHNAKTDMERREAYRGGKDRPFYDALYQGYDVVSHFTVDGSLYSRQGASFPVDVIVLRPLGTVRADEKRSTPWASVPRMFSTWQEIRDAHFNKDMADSGSGTGIRTGQGDNRNSDLPTGNQNDVGRVPGPNENQTPMDEGDVQSSESEPVVPAPVDAKNGGRRGGKKSGGPRSQSGLSGNAAGERGGTVNVPDADQTAAGRQTGDSGTGSDGVAGTGTAEPAVDPESHQAKYEPSSKNKTVDTLTPTNLQDAISRALEAVEDAHGPIDDFVKKELGYKKDDPYFKDMSAEQVDAIALAIHSHKLGSGMIVGDMTGVGKGRVAAAMMRYAERQGLVPVFITEKPDLFGDIYRDLADIGSDTDESPFLALTTNNTAGANGIELPNGRKLQSSVEDNIRHLNEAMDSRDSGNGFTVTIDGKPTKFNALFSMYSQLQTISGNETPRREQLRRLIPNAYLILDESHNAGGTKQTRVNENAPPDRAAFAREIVQMAQGVMYLSATFAKRPDVMDLYSKTDMAKAVDGDISQLAQVVKSGGLPLQQVLSAMLAESGQYVRREKSYEGIEFATVEVDVDLNEQDRITAVFRDIRSLDAVVAEVVNDLNDDLMDAGEAGVAGDVSTGDQGLTSTSFSSILWNAVDQMLFALKADKTADQAIEAWKRGEVPIIAVDNTMESILDEYVEANNLKVGDKVNLNFRDILHRYLERSRWITVDTGMRTERGKKITRKERLTDAQLNVETHRGNALAMFNAAYAAIEATDIDAPASPIDWIRYRLQKAGMKIAEVTGRSSILIYDDNNVARLGARPRSEKGTRGKQNTIRMINDGSLDGMLLNRSGATGLSVHASEKFRNQRVRHMIIAQPAKNIDEFMQMLGRVNRTGQVVKPRYSMLRSNSPAELRPAAVTSKKLSSLNASVTAKSKGAVDFTVTDVMNQVGGAVVQQYLNDNPEFAMALDMWSPLDADDDAGDEEASAAEVLEDIVRKATGRSAILPIDQQREFWDAITELYDAQIEELNALNANPLVAKTLDLDAKTLRTINLFAGDPDGGPFAAAANLQQMDIKSLGKPMPPDQVIAKIQEFYGIADIEDRHGAAIRWVRKQLESIREEIEPYREYLLSRVTTDEARESRQSMLDNQNRTVTNAIEEYPPGTVIGYIVEGQTFHGVVIGFSRKGKTGNPVAPSRWVIDIAINDPAKKLSVPVSRASNLTPGNKSLDGTLSEFQTMQTTSRQRRWIGTGNLVAAYAQLAAERGRLVFYTDDQGGTKRGILMPQNFRAGTYLEGRPVQFRKPEDILRFFQAGGSRLVTADGVLIMLMRTPGSLMLVAPRARGRGGKYTLNRGIINAAGRDFVTAGAQMSLTSTNRNQQIDILQAVLDLSSVEASLPSDREVARGVLGITNTGERRDDELGDVVAEPTGEPAEPQNATDKARQELQELRDEAAEYDKEIKNEIRKLGDGGGAATFLPITPELAKAIAGRMLVSLRIGVKSFEVFIRELRNSADLDESAIAGIRNSLIGLWNKYRSEFGLDEATPESFDLAMANATDAVLDQAIEAAKGETPDREPAGEPAETPDPAAEALPPERTYSTKNAFSAAERERLGMEERPPVERQPREPSIERAKALGKTTYGANRINALISELSVRPRAVTPEENDLLLFRNADLGERLETALRQLNASRKSGDDTQEAIADTTVRNLTAEKKTLIELILEPIGTEAGRALQARKAVVDQDFTLVRQALLFEAAHGRAPNRDELAAMQKQIDDLQASMAELKKLTDAQSAENDDLKTKLQEAHDALANATPAAPAAPVAPAPVPAPAPAPAPAPITPTEKTQKEKSREKVDAAYKRLKAVFGKLYSIEAATAEALGALTELATAYAELGVVSFGDFLSRIKKRMGPEAAKLIPLAKQAWRNVTSATMDDVQNRITSKIDPMDDDTIGRAARDLHRFVIDRDGLDASAEGREAAVDAVHEILVDIIPDLTRDQTARAMSGIGIYSPLSDDEIEAIRRDQKAQLLLLEQIGDWRKAAVDEANQPGSGKGPPATGLERPPVSDEQRALRKLVNDAKKAAGIVTATPGQLRSALDAAKRLARNRITDLNEALKPGGKPIAKNQKILRTDTELDALREERDRLQKLYDQAFGKPELSEEQRLNAAEKALDRAISNLEADLQAGKLYPGPKKPRLTSHAIEAKRAALEALKASRDEMRIQSGEAEARSDAAYKRHLLERDAELARRLAAGEFQPAAKKKERVLTPSMLKVMQSIDKQQKEILKKRREWIFENRHPVYKAGVKGLVGPAHAIRKGLTTFDESLIGRQGYLLGITHPKIYAKAIRKGFAENPLEAKTIFPTEQDLFNTEAALDADLNWVRLEKIGKVAVTGVHGGMNREEENQYVPEWFDKAPGIGGSERAGSGVINTQRRLVFRTLVENLATTIDGKRSISNAELRIIGNAVNVASGRASIGKWANSLEALTLVFFSPRWWVSRLAWWVGQPVWHESRWFGGEGASKEVRILVAKEWAKQAAAQAAIMSIAIAGLMAAFGDPGDDEEWDWYGNPISPEFGKLRVGSTMIDMTAGLGQHMSLFARLFSGKEVRRWEGVQDVDALRMIGSHERGKLAPIPSMTVDYFVGKSIDQKPVLSGEWFLSRMTPLIAQDVWEAVKLEGPATGAALAALMFFGIGANTREKRVKERGDIANELRAMQKQKQPREKIQKALNDHLKHTAGLEAKEDLRTADPDEAPALEKIVAGTDSAELAEAVEKERGDIAIRALERLSTEPGIGEKGSGEDAAIGDARMLLKAIAPTYEEANALFGRAYMQQNGPLTEIVGRAGEKRRVTKKNVVAARRRLKAIYAD